MAQLKFLVLVAIFGNLLVQAKELCPVVYIVQNYDSCGFIATIHGLEANEFVEINHGLDCTDLKVSFFLSRLFGVIFKVL